MFVVEIWKPVYGFECLACSRAYGRLYSAGTKKPYEHPGFQQLADQIYEELRRGR